MKHLRFMPALTLPLLLAACGGGVTVPADTVAPVLSSLTADATEVPLTGTVTLTATATDNVGVVRVEFYEGTSTTPFKTVSTHTNNKFATTVTFNDATGKARTYTARAFDKAGNASAALTPGQAVTVMTAVDGTSPSLTVTPPSTFVKTNTLKVVGTAADAGGIQSVAYTLTSPNGSTTSGPATRYANGTFDINLSSLTEGQYAISVRATDNADNHTIQTFTFTVDTVAPAPTLDTDDLVGSFELTGDPSFIVTPTDAAPSSGLASIAYTVTGATQSSGTALESGDGTYTVDLTSLPEGTHNLTVTATDNAGNAGTAVRSFTVDLYAPAVTVQVTPELGSFGANVTYGDTGSGLTSVTYSLNGAAPVTLDPSLGSAALRFDTLANGTHTLTVTAKDAAGRTTTVTRTVKISNTTPSITINPIGNTNDGTVTVTGQVSIEATSATYRVGSGPEQPLTLASDGTFSFPVSVSTQGSYTVTVTAHNSSGQSSQSATFLYDTVAPTIGPVTKAIAKNKKQMVLSFRVTDNAEVGTVKYQRNGTGAWTTLTALAGSTPTDSAYRFNVSLRTTDFVTIRAYDSAGTQANDDVIVDIP